MSKADDDVREALARIIQSFEGGPDQWVNFRDHADAILAAYDIRPKEPVTPRADDLREALALALFRNEHDKAPERWIETAWAVLSTRDEYLATADAILYEFEVRPREPVTDDVRDALARAISNSVMEDFAGSRREADAEGRHVARDILAAFEVRSRGSVPDAEVEAACRAFYEDVSGMTQWNRLVEVETEIADRYRAGMRAALEAARNA